MALEALDEVVDTIRKAEDSSAAAAALQTAFGLSDTQTDAVLSMPLRRLTSLEKVHAPAFL